MADLALKNILLDGVIAELQRTCRDEVNDETAAGVVREGKLQDDPGKNTGINILVYTEAHDEEDELYHEQDGITSPVYEIGGGGFYYSRFRILNVMHFRARGDEGRTLARTNAYTVQARILKTLWTMSMPLHPETKQPQDDFGMTVIDLQVDKFHLREGGGSGTFIWKGWTHFGFLVESPVRNLNYP